MIKVPSYKLKNVKRFTRKGYKGYKRQGPTKIIITVLLCAILIFVGYSMADPIYKFFQNIPLGASSEPAHEPVPPANNSSVPPSPSSNPDPIPEPPPVEKQAVRAMMVSAETLKKEGGLKSVTSQRDKGGLDTIIVDYKQTDGILHYNSAAPTAVRIGSVSKNAVDAAEIQKQIKAEGLIPAAKISCFDDAYAPAKMHDGSILYAGNQNWLWLDYAKGRKSWLDAGKTSARSYILELIDELASMGYEQIYLDHVQFPVWGSLDSAVISSDMSKEEAITSFIKEAKDRANSKNVKLGVIVPASGAVGDYHRYYSRYGLPQDVFSLPADIIVVDTQVSSQLHNIYYKSMQVDGETLTDLSKDPADTVEKIAKTVCARYQESKSEAILSFLLQGFSGKERTLTDEQITDQGMSVANTGCISYTFHNPTGKILFQ